MEEQLTREECMGKTIDRFWEVFPRIWHSSRVQVHNAVIKDQQLTIRQFAILHSVHHGKKSVSELADGSNISRPAISRSVDSLVNTGLITRIPDPHDRRYIDLALSHKGERLFESLSNEVRDWMSTRLEDLSDHELNIITKALDLLAKAFDD